MHRCRVRWWPPGSESAAATAAFGIPHSTLPRRVINDAGIVPPSICPHLRRAPSSTRRNGPTTTTMTCCCLPLHHPGETRRPLRPQQHPRTHHPSTAHVLLDRASPTVRILPRSAGQSTIQNAESAGGGSRSIEFSAFGQNGDVLRPWRCSSTGALSIKAISIGHCLVTFVAVRGDGGGDVRRGAVGGDDPRAVGGYGAGGQLGASRSRWWFAPGGMRAC